MYQLRIRLILLWLLLPALSPAHAAVPQLFLIQNSGWMEPFYTDERSQFRQTVVGLIAANAPVAGQVAEGQMIVATFNQDGQVPGRRSPEVIHRGAFDRRKITDAVAGIDLPRKSGGALADSDFEQALTSGISGLLQERSAIIWMITNNQNAPDNTPDWAGRTEAFFDLLRSSAQIRRIYAYPVRSEAVGARFGRKEGFIAYALAYGDKAAAELDARIGGDALQAVMKAPPVRLKPLDRQTLSFQIDRSSCTLKQAEWIRIDVRGGRQSDCVLEGRLRNRLYPQTVEAATVRVALHPHPDQPGLRKAQIAIVPVKIHDLPALGLSEPIRITLRIPPQRRDSLLTAETRAAGILTVELTDIIYGWDGDFLNRLAAVPLGDRIGAAAAESLVDAHLPDIFLDATRQAESRSDLHLQVVASHSRALLWLLVLGVLALLVLALILFSRRRTSRTPHDFEVDLGGEVTKVAIRRGERQMQRNSRGERFELIGRGRVPPKIRPARN